MTLKINNTHIPKFNPLADLGKDQKLSPSLSKDTLQGSSKKISKYSSCNWFVDGIKRVFEKFLSFLRCIFCCKCPKKAASDETIASTTNATKPDQSKKPGTTTIITPPIIKDPNSKEPLSAFEKMPLVIQNLVGEYLDEEDRLKLAFSFEDLSKKTYEDLVKDLEKREKLLSVELPKIFEKLKTLSKAFSGPVDLNANCEIVLDHCKNLKEFVFKRPFDAELLKGIASHLPPLDRVSFAKTNLTDEELNAFVQHCPQLSEIDLGDCDITDVGLKALETNCKQLQDLNLSFSRGYSREGVLSLVSNCKEIKRLGLSRQMSFISDNELDELTRKCPQLQGIELGFSDDITDAGMQILATNCKHLVSLRLSSDKVTDAGLQTIATHCKELQDLELSGSLFTSAGLLSIATNCKQLRRLVLYHFPEINYEQWRLIAAKSKQLQEINLEYCQITDAGLQALAENCQQLQGISITQYPNQFTGVGLQALTEKCKKLQRLDLRLGNLITDGNLGNLTANCKQLQELRLLSSKIDNITDLGLRDLAANCKQLKKLTLEHCKITDAGLQILAQNCKQLEEIDLSLCFRLTKAGLQELQRSLPKARIVANMQH